MNVWAICNYIDSLDNKIVTHSLIDPVDLRTILNNIQNVILKYLSLTSSQNNDIWTFHDFLKVPPTHHEWYMSPILRCSPCRQYLLSTTVPHTEVSIGQYHASQDPNHTNDKFLSNHNRWWRRFYIAQLKWTLWSGSFQKDTITLYKQAYILYKDTQIVS